ncbi:hypothetical protein PC129_g9995 [Phytophthora cactorum]|uniref:CCHC-type domain-containing protein n=1 Tax=Phytophthora cactorum TaxID=29920 RepID=A0A8T1I5E0_9STRA|nr:hypothetical protein PC129_g9995 [Phytophthora cactorum]
MEYEHGAENQPMDGNPSMRGPRVCNAHYACRPPPPGGSRVGGSPKTGNSHWGGGRSDDATDVVTNRATRCCSGLHSQGATRCCCRYDYDGVVRDDTARAVIEMAREQLCENLFSDGLSRSTLPLQLDASSTIRRRLRSPCHVLADERGAGRINPAHGRYVLRHNEFRSRAEFLDLQQGKHDVHAYAKRARYSVSNIATNPIDEATKVVTFMKGLRDGPVKTYLFREYPSTLEAAITLAMQEEFSLRQAKLHVNVPRMARPVMRTGGPEPMDLSNATAAGHQQRNNSSVRCFRCGYTGHYARECTAAVYKAGADVAMPGIAAINNITHGASRRGAPYC